jgi:hypothetical protein
MNSIMKKTFILNLSSVGESNLRKIVSQPMNKSILENYVDLITMWTFLLNDYSDTKTAKLDAIVSNNKVASLEIKHKHVSGERLVL